MNHFTEKQLEEADYRLDEIRDAKVEMELSDTPRTDETEKIADKMDSPAAAYGFTLARLREIEKELTAARAEIEEYKQCFEESQQNLTIEVEEVERLKLKLTAITEQRDRLAHELERITITGSAEHCRKIADEALQSLTTNEPK